jgi:hypothetical protein
MPDPDTGRKTITDIEALRKPGESEAEFLLRMQEIAAAEFYRKNGAYRDARGNLYVLPEPIEEADAYARRELNRRV